MTDFQNSKQFSQINEKEYINHSVFVNLNKIINFYDLFSFSVFGFLTHGVRGLTGVDTYMLSSIQGTVESMKLLLENGRINDSYTLLRKYHDPVIISIYTNLFLKYKFSFENPVVEEIDGWLNGNKKLPRYDAMIKYIEKSEELGNIYKSLNENNCFSDLRQICNDNTHYNSHNVAMHNDNQIYLKNRVNLLDSFDAGLIKIFILHVSCLFSLSDHYMMSSDYRDAMDIHVEPEENSQYFVAPFIQDIFNCYIKKYAEDVAFIIKSKSSMQIE